MSILCVLAVTYITVDLLGSAYLVRRFGGFRAAARLMRDNIRSAKEANDGDEHPNC